MFRKGRGGRGRGSSSNRPSLPFKLTKELDLGDGVTPRSKTRGSMFKVSQRKEQRKAARHKGRGLPKPTGSKTAPTTGRSSWRAEDEQEPSHIETKKVDLRITAP